MNKDDLIAFEEDIAAEFNAGRIPHPVHFSNGNEDALIRIFADVKPDDWVCCSWRSHYQCLLKGVPPADLKAAIMRGESIALCFPEHRIVSSAIVGGILPIAVGLATAIRRAGGRERVHCFLGDMTAETGIAHESMKYAHGYVLPIRFIVEENGLSVCTPVDAVWPVRAGNIPAHRYGYMSKYPHAGSGKRIEF